jgi:hypothetical protein
VSTVTLPKSASVGGLFPSWTVAMKLLTEYLDRALSLERLAADEQNEEFK